MTSDIAARIGWPVALRSDWPAHLGGRDDIQAGWAVAAVRNPRMLASVADRERTIKILQESFAEGRLIKAEFEQRVERAILARDFGELLALTADLPVGPFGRLPAHRVTPRLADQ